MARNIKERIEMLEEFAVVIDDLNTAIERLETWADEPGTSEECAKNYLNGAMIKAKVRDMIIKLTEAV